MSATEDRSGLRKADALERGVRVVTYADALAVLTSSEFEQIAHKEPAPSAVLLAGTMITLHGREHLERRRLENPLFEPRALRSYEEVAAEALRVELRRLADGTASIHCDLVPLVRGVVDKAGARIIGLDIETPEDAEEFAKFARAVEDAVQDSDYRTGSLDEGFWSGYDPNEIARFRSLLLDPAWARRRVAVEEQRAGKRDVDDLPLDLITLLTLNATDWEETAVVREVILYIIGATGTSSQSIFESILAIVPWLERHPDADATDPGLLRTACFEAIRIHPPPPALIRLAARDTVLPSGRQVAAGQIVYVDLPGANHDPAAFGLAAEAFDPDRPPADRGRPFGVAFGAGTHMCIGQRLATGRPRREVAEDEPLGLVPRLVGELLRAGIRLDPDRPPQLKENTLRRSHVSVPIVFDADALRHACSSDSRS